MNRLTLAFALGLAATLAPAGFRDARAAVVETTHEFHAAGDLDGDGREDLVIVDKATGVTRVAYQPVAGTYSWAEARGSGVENVSGISVGRVLATTRDALALASPDANRVNVFDLANPALPALPVAWFPPAVGPRTVVAVDIGGGGNTPHDDLYALTSLNDVPTSIRRVFARATAAGIASLGGAVASGDYSRGDRVQLKAGGPTYVGLAASAAGGPFEVFSLATGAPALVATAPAVPANARWVHQRFGAGALYQYLFFQPGGTTLQLRAVQELVPGAFSFGAPVVFDLGRVIDAVTVLPGASSSRLLVLADAGTTAAVYQFDGVAAPVLVRAFAAPAGEVFTGGAATGDLGTFLFTGSAATRRSEGWSRQRWDGAQYVAEGSGRLPDGTAYAAAANVFVFRSEPFVSPSPVLVQRLAAGDWTSQPALAGAPLKINVTVESFGGAAAGLGTPVARALGDVTPPGAFALANQYTPAISLFTFVPPVGDEVVEVQITPAPGPQSGAVQVSLTASVAGSSLFYRIDGAGSWSTYTAPLPLFRDTTLRYYAQAPGSDRKSVVRTATYSFPGPPADQDSDRDGVPDYAELGLDANNNGVPDYAELGKGLEPVVSGKDADGDGFGDLDEFVAGTNPYSAASTPAVGTRLEDQSGFELLVSPRPLDGTTGNPTTAQVGANVRLHALPGELLRFNRATNLPAPAPAGVPTARLTNVPVDTGQRFLVLATEPHFAINTAGVDKQLGRELLGFLPVPPLAAGLPVSRTLGAGTLKAEAAAWRTAAQAAAAARPRSKMVQDLSPRTTLVALLVEFHLELLLQARGLEGDGLISLFPFRVPDAGRHVPTQDELLALEREDAGQPAFRLADVQGVISNLVATSANPNIVALRRLADDVYRIGSASNNAAPGVFRLPADALRDFLRGGVLEPAYRDRLLLSNPDFLAAAAGVGDVLAAPAARPKATVNLSVSAGGVTGDCTTLHLAGQPRSLFFADGSAFLFPESFEVVPGSAVQVTGYTDLPVGGGGCAGPGIEVIEARVVSVPAVPTLDADGDLMPDNYECAFFGSLAAGPLDDPDGDGFGNLQEFLDGTDPKDKLAKGVTPVVLMPPVVDLVVNPGGTLGLKWKFPAAYAAKFKFGVKTAPTLSSGFADIPVTVASLGADNFQVQLPLPAGATQFYYLYFTLR